MEQRIFFYQRVEVVAWFDRFTVNVKTEVECRPTAVDVRLRSIACGMVVGRAATAYDPLPSFVCQFLLNCMCVPPKIGPQVNAVMWEDPRSQSDAREGFQGVKAYVELKISKHVVQVEVSERDFFFGGRQGPRTGKKKNPYIPLRKPSKKRDFVR